MKLQMMRIFEYAFSIHLMRNILGITTELSLALQRKKSRYYKCHVSFENSQAAVLRNEMCWMRAFPYICFFILCPT